MIHDIPRAATFPDSAQSAPAVRTVQTGGGPLRYVQAGEGRDVVLIHGAITSLEDMLLGPFDALAARFRVTALDRPGHGLSPRARLHGAPLQQADRVREAVEALGLDRPILVGQSFGATLALDYALAFLTRPPGCW